VPIFFERQKKLKFPFALFIYEFILSKLPLLKHKM